MKMGCMRPVETIPGMEREAGVMENNGGGEFKYETL
jgi:hypothetical protein